MLTTSPPDASEAAASAATSPTAPSGSHAAPDGSHGGRGTTRRSRLAQLTHGPSSAPDDPRLQQLISIASQRRALDAQEAELLADPGTSIAALEESGHHLNQWLAATTQQSPTVASQRVRVAQRLRRNFDQFASALTEGRVGWNHIEAFHRAANPRIREQLMELQAEFIELAQHATFARWCRELRGVAALLDQDGGFDPAADPSKNWLKLTPTYGGALDVSGRLVGELAAQISAIIDAETTRVLDRHRADRAQVDGNTSGHDGGGQDESDADNALRRRTGPSRAQAAAEALGELLERAVSRPEGCGSAPTPHLAVTLDTRGGTPTLTTDVGERLSNATLRWLVAAASIDTVEVSDTGDPLRMGRRSRYATPQQRRALTIRDGGCVFPGCDRPPGWCDAHHVDEWLHGGPTDVENMALICRHHHRVTHQPGWKMTPIDRRDWRWAADDSPRPTPVWFKWVTPSGRTVYSQRHHTIPANSP